MVEKLEEHIDYWYEGLKADRDLIFPDLNTGNNTYKAVQRETGAIAIAPIVQGLKKPVNDLSRGGTVDDIINTVAITAIEILSSF